MLLTEQGQGWEDNFMGKEYFKVRVAFFSLGLFFILVSSIRISLDGLTVIGFVPFFVGVAILYSMAVDDTPIKALKKEFRKKKSKKLS